MSRHWELRWWPAATAFGRIVVLSGCALLLPVGGLVGSVPVTGPAGSPVPGQAAVYHSGTAEVQLSGGTNEQLRLHLIAEQPDPRHRHRALLPG